MALNHFPFILNCSAKPLQMQYSLLNIKALSWRSSVFRHRGKFEFTEENTAAVCLGCLIQRILSASIREVRYFTQIAQVRRRDVCERSYHLINIAFDRTFFVVDVSSSLPLYDVYTMHIQHLKVCCHARSTGSKQADESVELGFLT